MTPETVRTIRRAAGLSQTGLAAIIRIADLRTIRRWEKGEIGISGPASILMEMIHTGELPERFWRT